MLRSAIICALVVSCSSENPATVDARPPGPGPCTPAPDTCSTTCGNGVLDSCSVPLFPGSCVSASVMEQCDGNPSCATVGYYEGGASVCAGCQRLDDSACEACAPDIACTTLGPFAPLWIAVNGTHTALLASQEVKVFDGGQQVATTTITSGSGVEATSQGFVVAMHSPARIRTLSIEGVLGPERALPEPDAIDLQIASGPNGLVIAVWSKLTSQSPVTYTEYRAIVDSAGNVVVPAAPIFERSAMAQVNVISDGTSFFVGNGGKIARVSVDGTANIVTGYPTGVRTWITWSGTHRWYVASPNYVAQQFDAAGTKVGSSVSIALGGTALDLVGSGSGLVALRAANNRQELVQIDSEGALGAPKEIGAGPYGQGLIARVGSDVFASWSRRFHRKLQVVFTAPP